MFIWNTAPRNQNQAAPVTARNTGRRRRTREKFSQVCAATTNGSFGNQTFGITSGTLECEKPATFASNEKLNTFVAENMDNLARDIARGDGEYLSTLAVLLDIPVQERPVLYTRLQANFSTIYTSSGVTHLDVLRNLETLLSSI